MKKNLGEFYDETSDFQQAQFNYLVKLVKDNLKTDSIDTLLDIGAGTGKRTKECFDIFPNLNHVTALEPDPDMYRQAIENHKDERIQYLKKPASHVSQMEIGAGHFDLILSHWTLHWVQDKQALFESLERVIDKESKIVFSTCERLPQILTDLDEYIRVELGISPYGESPFHYYDRTQWEDLLKSNGWKIACAESFTVDHMVDDAATYLEHWFTASTGKFTYNRHLVEISELSRKDLVWFMENKYGTGKKEGQLKFTEDVLFVIAEK